MEFLSRREAIRPAYRRPADRVVTLDEQGLAGCLLFPTLGMIYEEPLAHDPEAVCHLFRAFNRWLVEDWGTNFEDRIFAAPYLTLADPDWAVRRAHLVARARAPARSSCGPAAPDHGAGSPVALRPDVRRVLAAGQRRRHHRGGPRRRQRDLVERLRRRRVRRHLQRRVEAIHQVVRHRAGHPRLPALGRLREPVRAVPQPAAGLGRERRPVPARPHRQGALDGQQDAGLLVGRPGRDVPAPRVDQPVLGGRRQRGGRLHGPVTG